MEIENLDLAIVGAGWHGLGMAKTYSEAYPEARIAIFDSGKSVGGVWAKERLYPGLKTNNLVGSYEFGDFPMALDRFGLQRGQHIPGAVVHEYLRQFAEEFNLTSRLIFNTKVVSAELLEDGEWGLQVSDVNNESSGTIKIRTKKLVVATGLTSKPNIPTFPGRAEYQGNVFHSIHLRDRAKDIEAAKEVVVLGANKSAWDTCYSAAVSGAHVNMVVRPGGGGPSWVWPVTFSPFQLSIQQIATTRLWTLFEPTIWNGEASGFSWARYLLHSTSLGRKFVSMFWKALDKIVHRANGYDNHPELQKLKPWSTTFWMGNSLGIHNYQQNWFDLVRKGRIHIHVADVTSLSGKGVHLSNGAVVNADTFVCCTGWEVLPPIKFIPETLTDELGLPSSAIQPSEVQVQHARAQILEAAPSLRAGPRKVLPKSAAAPIRVHEHKNGAESTRSNYQLYRFLVPSSAKFFKHRNIAFIGSHLALNAITVAQAQALWITAFFNDKVESLRHSNIDHADVEYETILHTEYARLRHPGAGSGAGERCPDLVFDGLLYTDSLLRDLGLEAHRKKSWWKELVQRYLPGDYRGLVAEWKRKNIIH
ncbi:hypothetical protein LTR84_006635 [Exophiala bonariae]|uniref:L-ornithine N(5)-oxygenase n=1 Tax=Exophiala bonariae TaxID=1690606 RepID=A0AAV9N408_9EURO|nr:hypothetical protein LTR84_006635 [Exophiala bonariae]